MLMLFSHHADEGGTLRPFGEELRWLDIVMMGWRDVATRVGGQVG